MLLFIFFSQKAKQENNAVKKNAISQIKHQNIHKKNEKGTIQVK